MKKFTVSCTNPSKGSIESCTFDAAEWTVVDAVHEFCGSFFLERSEVEVEPLDENGKVILAECVAGVEVDRIFG